MLSSDAGDEMGMTAGQDFAETIALQALGWIAGQEDLLPVFLNASGAAAEDVRQRAADPEFLASVLDFLVMDDTWVIGFCDAAGLAYATPMEARRALPGGGETHWT